MKAAIRSACRTSSLVLLALLLITGNVSAFPPAPHHTVFGIVRDEMGEPLNYFNAEVLLEVEGRTVARTMIVTGLEPGVNYRLAIPMDSGATSDLYKPSALRPTVPFRMRVRIGSQVFLPIEMTGASSLFTRPSATSRVDLTLGVDADGNGLPDAWERAMAAFLGREWIAGEIRPDDLYGDTGMTIRDVYLAGIYDLAPEEGFALQIIPGGDGPARLAFTAVSGRSYTVQAAANLGEWTTVPFKVLPAGPQNHLIPAYQATDTRRVEIEAPELPGATARFFRLLVH